MKRIELLVITGQFEHKRHMIFVLFEFSVKFQMKAKWESSANHKGRVYLIHAIIFVSPMFFPVFQEAEVNPFQGYWTFVLSRI